MYIQCILTHTSVLYNVLSHFLHTRYDESNKVWVLGGGSEDEMEGWIDTGRDGGKSGEWEEVDREDWKGEENKNELTRDQVSNHKT